MPSRLSSVFPVLPRPARPSPRCHCCFSISELRARAPSACWPDMHAFLPRRTNAFASAFERRCSRSLEDSRIENAQTSSRSKNCCDFSVVLLHAQRNIRDFSAEFHLSRIQCSSSASPFLRGHTQAVKRGNGQMWSPLAMQCCFSSPLVCSSVRIFHPYV